MRICISLEAKWQVIRLFTYFVSNYSLRRRVTPKQNNSPKRNRETAHCLLPTATVYCLLPAFHFPLPISYCLPPIVFWPVPTVYCPLPMVQCLLLAAHCPLLSTAYQLHLWSLCPRRANLNYFWQAVTLLKAYRTKDAAAIQQAQWKVGSGQRVLGSGQWEKDSLLWAVKTVNSGQ